jgi:2-hydroxy-3-oxopropionate reductase
MQHREVVLIGLGQMGSRYGRRLLDAGVKLTVWNRSQHRTQPLAELGARVAPSASAAIASGRIVICALENSAAFSSTLLSPEALDSLSPEHIVIDTSTVNPKDSCAASDILSTRGTRYLDAPVSGGTHGAAEGTLTIFVGGKPDDFHVVAPVLEILGTPHLLGPTGAGHKAKLANQVMVAVTIGAAAEGLFLAQRVGLDPAQLLSAFRGGFADSRILREHGDRMARSDFTPGAANRVFLKDLNAVASMADEQSTVLPLLLHCQRAFSELIASGLGEHDHSSYFEYLSMLNSTR